MLLTLQTSALEQDPQAQALLEMAGRKMHSAAIREADKKTEELGQQ